MSSCTTARACGSSARRLFQSYHSYSRVPGSLGAYGLVHVIRRSNRGNRRNIPAGSGSCEIRAWATPNRDRQ